MRACIVGHGPSLCQKEYGPEIDSHDVVIRLKRSQNLLARPKLFGSKTDIAMSSLVVGQGIRSNWCKRYWLFVDTRTLHVCDIALRDMKRAFLPDSCLIDKPLCAKWIKHYRHIRQINQLDPRQEAKASNFDGKTIYLSDELGHLHPSAGMFAIIYALEHLKPFELNLYGFDNIAKGNFDWSVTRGPDYAEYPDHNWKTEHSMLWDVLGYYNCHSLTKDYAGVIRCASAM